MPCYLEHTKNGGCIFLCGNLGPHCALVQKLPVAWTLLKIELMVVLGITAYYAAQASF